VAICSLAGGAQLIRVEGWEVGKWRMIDWENLVRGHGDWRVTKHLCMVAFAST